VELYYELSGSGEPLVLVHGSWGDHHNWDPVVGSLSQSFQVLTFDRRGHSASERPAGQGSVFEDADDLAGLLEELGLTPRTSPATRSARRLCCGRRRAGRRCFAV
jgi:pimeloyl-ACP methyl ester carboxylesterase